MSWPFPGVAPGEYGAILADVPSKFKVYSSKGAGRSPERHYRTMPIPEIKKIPVLDLAAPDCFLFFWTSGSQLKNAIEIIDAWGFKYSSTAFVWLKLNRRAHEIFWTRKEFFMGQGYTTRKNAEFCLLATRGKPKRKSKKVRELIFAPRREHSRKPDEIYQNVEDFAPGPYVELFSRTTAPGWQCFGDESDKFSFDGNSFIREFQNGR